MRSVLITGGTGFLGRALARRLITSGCARVCIYSRGEHAQAAMRSEFTDSPYLRWFIGDVRDQLRLRRAMEGCEAVIHAAALKRIEVGAYNPSEMVKTNVLGTMNVIEAAQDAGVRKAIAVSSDKAWQPISPYGQSKALMETLFLQAERTRGEHGPHFAVVRYGNVMGSTGSVIPTWRALIAQHEHIVPVTDVNATRFWMTRDEAVSLVLEAAMNAPGGELVIPEGMPAFDLGSLAEAMRVTPEVKGLPAWEKLHEGLADGLTSDKARRMSVRELREALCDV